MRGVDKILRIGIMIVILFAFVSLFLQDYFKYFKERPLIGAYSKTSITVLTTDDWFDGVYQKNLSNYLNENFAFRPLIVRLQNQIDYTLFSKINTSVVFEGKDNYLFRLGSKNYHADYRGRAYFVEQVRKYQYIQSCLKALNKTITFVIAPGKHSVLPEYLPDTHIYEPDRDSSNYNVLVKLFHEEEINYLDLNKYYLELKDTVAYPLFAKSGIHWTRQASAYALDTIADYLEWLNMENYPDLIIRKPEIEKPEVCDIDIYRTMNIFQACDEVDLYSCNFAVDTIYDKKPKVLVVSDSFYDAPFQARIPKILFHQDSEYWYYNKRAKMNTGRTIPKKSAQEIVERCDHIIIMMTMVNIRGVGWHILDDLEVYFKSVNEQ